MSSGPATILLLCGNPLQGPRKLLDAAGRLVVETKSPELARHALETMAVALFVCDLATEGVDFAALSGAGLAANPGMRILFCGGRQREPVARQLLADLGAQGGFFSRPFNALSVRKAVSQAVDAALADGAGRARPGGGAAAGDGASGSGGFGAEGPDPERFEILGLAGKGGTGTVYRARSKFLGIEVALKVVDRELLEDPDVLTAFKDEARITMQLSHPNILRTYSFQAYRGCPYIVMELVRGTSLREAILSNGALSTVTACQILAQCAAALGYAHANNVVHKDVKPENIFVTESGELKIIDFGAAVLNDARAQTSGDVVGTPEYMCPEQLRGEPVGPGADIYALGVMTYLMLVGCFPFPPDTTVDDLLAGRRPDFSALAPELASVLARATAYEASFRYDNVAEFARDVIHVCGCESAVLDPFAPIEIVPAQLPDASAPAEAVPDAAAYPPDAIPEGVGAFDYAPEDAPDAPAYGEAPADPAAQAYDGYPAGSGDPASGDGADGAPA